MQTTMTLSQVQSFAYIIAANAGTPGVASLVANSPEQLIITAGGAADGPSATRSNFDPNHSKLIFGYIDVAEAAPYAEPSLFSGGAVPSWFGAQNPGYPGLYTVQYWNPAWEPLIFSQIDKIIAEGYDGILLDVLSGYGEWSTNNIEGNPVNPAALQNMANLVTDIGNYVASKNLPNGFYLIGNNPEQIPQQFPLSLKHLNGIFNESLNYTQQQNNGKVSVPTSDSFISYLTSQLAPIYDSANLPVFGNDYPPLSNMAADFQTFAEYTTLGWIPSVTTAFQSTAILSTGPYMAMAVAANPTVVGAQNLTSFLSGGLLTAATLIGGGQTNYFIGGPGTNNIQGGADENTIYAHPASAALKYVLDLRVRADIRNVATPTLTVLVNGTVAFGPALITASFSNGQTQDVQIDTKQYGTLASVELLGTGMTYIDSTDYSNIQPQSISYEGQLLSFAAAQVSSNAGILNNGATCILNNNGTVTIPGLVFQGVSPFAADTADTIDGGGGTTTVVYRANYGNYTVQHLANGSLLLTSAATAEGPDSLTNVQALQFADITAAVEANGSLLVETGAANATKAAATGGSDFGGIAVSDSAANVANALDALEALAAGGKLGSIVLTDGGIPTLAVTAAQLTTDSLALHDISGSYALTHLIHCIAGIRKRAWYNHLESLRDWVLTPLSSPGQNLPCPPPTTVHCCRSLCQTSARRRSLRPSMEDRSVRTAVCSFWLPPISVLA